MKSFHKCLLTVSSILTIQLTNVSALADDLTLRVEQGTAVAVSDKPPLAPGAAISVKPEFGFNPYLSFGPAGQFLLLSGKGNSQSVFTAWDLGGFLRIKRPHDQNNRGNGWSAVSPWWDVDFKYVRAEESNCFGWATGAGFGFPISDLRELWLGPFVRYHHIHRGSRNFDLDLLTVGLSLEAEFDNKSGKPVNLPANL